MKTLILLLITSTICFAQSPYKQVADQGKKEQPTFKFDDLNAAIVKERNVALRNFQKADSAMQIIAIRMLNVHGIDPSTASDSTRITPEGIFLKLKPKKK